MSSDEPYGYLLAHFREDPAGFAERIHFSLSTGDSPLRWTPLWGGRPRLTSNLGTTGVRDPAIVRGRDGRFHILATDLRVFGGDDRGWDEWRRHGSRSMIIWDSKDLVDWTGPRAVEVAPAEAGMAWAPEVIDDPHGDGFVVFWSSTLYEPLDVEHVGESYSRILYSRTRDFETFTPAQVMIDAGRDIIDTAIVSADGLVHRFSKDEDRGDASWGIHHEIGSSLFADDFRVVRRRIAAELHRDVEAPILVRDPVLPRWYLMLDRYGSEHGYFVLQTDDLASSEWAPVAADEVEIPDATKHGTVLRLTRPEWLRLRAAGATEDRGE